MAKRKLTRTGIQYFDAGGIAMPQQTTFNGNGLGAGASYIMNPGNSFVQGLNPTNLPGLVSNVAGAAGNAVTGLAADFTAQNGYQAKLAPTSELNYGPLLSASANNSLAGYNQFGQNLSNEGNLAAALMAESRGEGPNPALSQLAATTGQNVATQGALMAGARGGSSNAGLLARQIANGGAGVQQTAAGQAATLAAQQQLAAKEAAGSLYGQIGNQITGEQGANNSLFNTAVGGQNNQNNTSVNNYGMAQGINAQVAQNNSNAVNKNVGGLLNGGAGLLSSLFAKGGEVKRPMREINPKTDQVPAKNRLSNQFYPQHLKEMGSIYHPHLFLADGGSVIQVPEINGPPADSGGGGGDKGGGGGMMSALPALLALLAKGGTVETLNATGGNVPGKAKVKGDSYQNDTVDAKLSPGEVVIPRSVMESDDPAGNAAKFVESLKHKYPSKADHDDFKLALKRAISTRKMKHAA